MVIATVADNFNAGPFAFEADGDLFQLGIDERLIVAFADFEVLFTVIGQARGAVHFGMFLTPWQYVHWRAQQRHGRWSLVTTDRAEIGKLKRFYGL